MTPICILILFVLFYSHAYYYDRAGTKTKNNNVILTAFKRYFSPKYMLPLSKNANDSPTIVRFKKISNLTLYGFYLLLVLTFVYVGLSK